MSGIKASPVASERGRQRYETPQLPDRRVLTCTEDVIEKINKNHFFSLLLIHTHLSAVLDF